MKTEIIKTKVVGLVLSMMILFVGFPSASAAVTVFQSGTDGNYNGLTDTYVDYQGDVNANWGGRNLMLVYNKTNDSPEQKTAMLNFDMSSIAEPVVVSSATLSILVAGNVERTSGYSQTYNLYAITRSGLNFGTSIGVPEIGAVSFSAAAYDPTTPLGWGSLNTGTNGPVPGENYSNTLLGSFTLTDANVNTGRVSISLNASTVASWINSPSTNYGFVITAAIDPAHDQAIIYSSENDFTAAPWLEFEYTAVPEPATATMLGLAAFALGFHQLRRGRK